MAAAGPEPRARRVADVMRRDFITVEPNESVLEAVQIMQLARLRHLLVVREGELLGVLTYRDLQRESLNRLGLGSETVPAERGPLGSLRVRDLMVHSPDVVTPDTPIEIAAARLCRLEVGCLPVVDAQTRARLVGLVTETDLLRAAYDRWFSTRT